MRKTIGMVLAAGRVPELAALTEMRPKSAVVFGGSYRIIDFAMTNLVDSGIEIIGVLSQYRPVSLIDHIAAGAPWDRDARVPAGAVLPRNVIIYPSVDEADFAARPIEPGGSLRHAPTGN